MARRLSLSLILGSLLAVGCRAAVAPTRVLVDFETPDAIRVASGDCTARVVEGLDGRALEVTCREGAAYPGVSLTLPQGPWDLTGAEYLTADVQILTDRAARVLLGADNPGSDGVNRNNTAGTSVGPGKRVTVKMPFGEWHGSPRPLDMTQIVALRVFLERPPGSVRFLVDNLTVIRFDRAAMETLMAGEFYQSLTNPLGRGVNMGNMLEAPNEGEWGVRLDEGYFKIIAEAGFENVRIPIRWSSRTATEPPYTIRPDFLARVDRALDAALAAGLKVVLNIHHYEEIMREPKAHRERFLAIWRQLAEHYRARPPELLFELLNEPASQLDADTFNEFVAAAIQVIRQTNPERWIVVGPVNWNAYDQLERLELPAADRRLIATFHYYNPFQFTHQGAGWVGQQSNQWLGTKWTGTEAERRAIDKQFDVALKWAIDHRRPLYVGEFGAYGRADMESRAKWTRYVADAALARKMGFAYWEFASGFGCWDPQANTWREPLKKALLGQD